MTDPPLPFETQNVHKSAPPGSRETAGARGESPDRSRKKTNPNQIKKRKSQLQQAARVRYTFHARRRKPTRNAQSTRLFCVIFFKNRLQRLDIVWYNVCNIKKLTLTYSGELFDDIARRTMNWGIK